MQILSNEAQFSKTVFFFFYKSQQTTQVKRKKKEKKGKRSRECNSTTDFWFREQI